MANVAGIPVWREMGASPMPSSSSEKSPITIVGAGPVGLTLALDLGQRGHNVILVNLLDFVSAGSKAICFAKRTLDIWDRLGVGKSMVNQGVIWDTGKVFWGSSDTPVYQFDMLPVKSQKMPGFINLQQYHAEVILIEAVAKLPNVDVRWGHKVTRLESRDDGATLEVETADGSYGIESEWVIACDGSRSTIRGCLGLDFEGRIFEDNFLIADVKMEQERPSERWFWFDPPFNRGQSALMHKQPDNVWRLDFQLGWDIDREACIRPENVEPYVRAMLGEDVEFTPEWYSVYTFQCRRMARFLHGRVIFAGDAAHLVSPFGARGCNGGVADIENLGWKLDAVLKGAADTRLLETYNDEAIATADENILNSSRATDFMTPKTAASSAFRDAVLELARDYPFARPFVNSGRLSMAAHYSESALNTPDEEGVKWRGVAPGSPALDAPMGDGWLLERLVGSFKLVAHGAMPGNIETINVADALLAIERYDLEPGSAILIRPDQYVAARFRQPTVEKMNKAIERAMGSWS